jgi:hypothetical protein
MPLKNLLRFQNAILLENTPGALLNTAKSVAAPRLYLLSILTGERGTP